MIIELKATLKTRNCLISPGVYNSDVSDIPEAIIDELRCGAPIVVLRQGSLDEASEDDESSDADFEEVIPSESIMTESKTKTKKSDETGGKSPKKTLKKKASKK